MKNILTRLSVAVLVCLISAQMSAQTPILIHSHNDYRRTVPFYEAYSQGVHSIEVDCFYRDGVLLVGHDVEDLDENMTVEKLYVRPLAEAVRRNGGHPYADPEHPLQLMVELKSATEPSLAALVDLLSQYADVYCSGSVAVTITGNVPAPEEFGSYPEFIRFDGDIDIDYTPEQLARVALFSMDLRRYSTWNGKGSLVVEQEKAVREVIARAHALGKPIRFWDCPEGTTVYYTLYDFGVDYVNTDKPAVCAEFFRHWGDMNFQMGGAAASKEGVTSGTKVLDKVTRSFAGFQRSELQLSRNVEVYHPTYRNDGAHKRIKNVILLIGDGMGINQVLASEFVNREITMFQMRYFGMQHTASKDQFTTDSAAGGSALGTGVKHANRHISSMEDGTPLPSLTDWFHDMGKATGVLTLGNVVDATPTVFYGHNVERDDSDDLTADLLESKADLVCGSGYRDFVNRQDGRDIMKELSEKYIVTRSCDEIGKGDGRMLCIDDRMDEMAKESTLDLLATATRNSISHLSKMSRKGFFLMVEGAKIDYAGHSDCMPGSILEQLSFDMAVAEALRFADTNGETLVVVTADHETGGLVLLDGDLESGRLMGVYVSNDHTPSMVPVFAYGPHADEFIGIYQNTDVPNRIKALTKK